VQHTNLYSVVILLNISPFPFDPISPFQRSAFSGSIYFAKFLAQFTRALSA
jgi:hypothetical protein